MTVKSTANGSTKKPSRFAAAEASRAQSSDRLMSAIEERSRYGEQRRQHTRLLAAHETPHERARRRRERRVQRHQPPERTRLSEADEEPPARVEVEGETERRQRDHDDAAPPLRSGRSTAARAANATAPNTSATPPARRGEPIEQLGAKVRESSVSATAIAIRPPATTARERPSRHPSAPTAPMTAATSVPDTWGNVPRRWAHGRPAQALDRPRSAPTALTTHEQAEQVDSHRRDRRRRPARARRRRRPLLPRPDEEENGARLLHGRVRADREAGREEASAPRGRGDAVADVRLRHGALPRGGRLPPSASVPPRLVARDRRLHRVPARRGGQPRLRREPARRLPRDPVQGRQGRLAEGLRKLHRRQSRGRVPGWSFRAS